MQVIVLSYNSLSHKDFAYVPLESPLPRLCRFVRGLQTRMNVPMYISPSYMETLAKLHRILASICYHRLILTLIRQLCFVASFLMYYYAGTYIN